MTATHHYVHAGVQIDEHRNGSDQMTKSASQLLTLFAFTHSTVLSPPSLYLTFSLSLSPCLGFFSPSCSNFNEISCILSENFRPKRKHKKKNKAKIATRSPRTRPNPSRSRSHSQDETRTRTRTRTRTSRIVIGRQFAALASLLISVFMCSPAGQRWSVSVDFVGAQVEVEVGRNGQRLSLYALCVFANTLRSWRSSPGDRDPAEAMTKR